MSSEEDGKKKSAAVDTRGCYCSLTPPATDRECGKSTNTQQIFVTFYFVSTRIFTTTTTALSFSREFPYMRNSSRGCDV